jgi:hypothetical protein
MEHPALPTNTSGNVVFNSGAFNSRSGIYQKLSNLVIGTNYTILLLMFLQQGQDQYLLVTNIYNGTTLVTGQSTLVQQQQLLQKHLRLILLQIL